MDYHNENDPRAADWLEWLIANGHIPPGWVDRRSIADVQPGDLLGYRRHHFFAGIGGWPLAIELARAPADWRIWTASCPCQPFSSAGRRLGSDDPRHLWPHLLRLIDAFRPARILGEQVAGAAGYGWFDGVALNLGACRYASRSVDIPAAAVDSPQIRQRLYWAALRAAGPVAGSDSDGPAADGRDVGQVDGLQEGERWPDHNAALSGRGDGTPVGILASGLASGRRSGEPERRPEGRAAVAGDDAGEQSQAEALGHSYIDGRQARDGSPAETEEPGSQRLVGTAAGANEQDDAGAALGRASSGRLAVGKLAGGSERTSPRRGDVAGADDGDAGAAQGCASLGSGQGSREPEAPGRPARRREYRGPDDGGRNGSWWAGADWITCHDGKARRVADALAPLLVTGFPGRVVAWRGVGNAIVPPLACEVVAALIETEGEEL